MLLEYFLKSSLAWLSIFDRLPARNYRAPKTQNYPSGGFARNRPEMFAKFPNLKSPTTNIWVIV